MIVVGFGSSPLLSFSIQISSTPGSRIDGCALAEVGSHDSEGKKQLEIEAWQGDGATSVLLLDLESRVQQSCAARTSPSSIEDGEAHTVTNFEATTLPSSSCLGCRGKSNSLWIGVESDGFTVSRAEIDDIYRAATAAWPTLIRKVYSIGHRQPRRADPTAESRMKAPNLEIKTGREPMAIGPTGEELPWSGNLVKITSDHCKGEKDRKSKRRVEEYQGAAEDGKKEGVADNRRKVGGRSSCKLSLSFSLYRGSTGNNSDSWESTRRGLPRTRTPAGANGSAAAATGKATVRQGSVGAAEEEDGDGSKAFMVTSLRQGGRDKAMRRRVWSAT
ncbi:hypothetical protein BHM03_00052689 [Ensete ventricosum]|nr:hypothetical protein BHM03_00052689 [Ensete ventricosum]